MHSPTLDKMSKEDRKALETRLFERQEGVCFICQKKIEMALHELDVDHIIPLSNGGKDEEVNFALTHATCNRSKNDSNLEIARSIFRIKNIQADVSAKEHRDANLDDLLKTVGGAQYDFQYTIEGNQIKYTFDKIGDSTVYTSPIFTDNLSKEQTCFVELPLSYLFHDHEINPRGINSTISKLIKEFYSGNPQLHTSLARIKDGKVCIFDGQHKAVAQIVLGTQKLLVRIFLNPNFGRLRETNKRAGYELRQVAFDKGILTQLNSAQYNEKVKEYQTSHKLAEDDFSFSEMDVAEYFKGDKIKTYITDNLKENVVKSPENKLIQFIDFEGRGKDLPISYNAFSKTFLSIFIDTKKILTVPLDSDNNPRNLEKEQLIRLENMIAENLFIGKYKAEVGVAQIENKLISGKDAEITDSHLVCTRLSREHIMWAWLTKLGEIIETNFYANGKAAAVKDGNGKNLFKTEFPEQLWINIDNYLKNLIEIPLWKDRTKASSTFNGNPGNSYWQNIFNTGKDDNGAELIPGGIDVNKIVYRD